MLYYNKMKTLFFLKFTQQIKEDKNRLIGIVCLEDILRNYIPLYKLICNSNRYNIYDDYSDCYLYMKFISSIIYYSNVTIDTSVYKLMKNTLRYHCTNPIMYIYIIFCILDRDYINDYEYDILRSLNNIELYTFLVNRLTDSEGDIRYNNNIIYHMMSLCIQLIEVHYISILDMLNKVKILKEQDLNNNNNKFMRTESYSKISDIDIEQYKYTSSDIYKKRSYSVQLDEDNKDPMNMNGLLSHQSMSIDKCTNQSFNMTFIKDNKLLYYLPNIYLGKNTLMIWLNIIIKIISRKKPKDLYIELKTIIRSLRTIKDCIEQIIQEYKMIAFHNDVEMKELNTSINDIMCKLVLECEDVSCVSDMLTILSELSNESFTRKLSSDIFYKINDGNKTKVMTKIVDFLLEECYMIDKPDLKVEIYENVCKFIKGWYQSKKECIMVEKTIDLLIKLIDKFKEISSKVLINLIDFMLQLVEKNMNTFIDFIDKIDRQKKHQLLIELDISILNAILACIEPKNEDLKLLNLSLIKLLCCSLMQSKTIWKMCLEYEEDYGKISSIQDKVFDYEGFVTYYKSNTPLLSVLFERLKQVKDKDKDNNSNTITNTNIIDMSNMSMLDLKSIRKYDPKDDGIKELRSKKNAGAKADRYQDMIFNINKKQILISFWTKDRSDRMLDQLSKDMNKFIEYLGNKRFVLSYNNQYIDNIHKNNGYQYLITLSGSLSLDLCSRKIQIIKKRYKDFSLNQKFTSIKEDVYISNNKKKMNVLELGNNINNSTDNNAEISMRRITRLDRMSINNSSSDKNIKKRDMMDANISTVNAPQLIHKKMSESYEDEPKFEIIFDILGYYFNIDDEISMGYNVGMIYKDWNQPMDCVLLIGKKGCYIKTNYMIKYEREMKILINLVGKDAARSYHLGKWYMDLESMTLPFSEDTLTKNKYRKTIAQSIDKMYEIRYENIQEIHSKHYIGRCPIALEIWTNTRRPYLLVFNKSQIIESWNMIFENWVRVSLYNNTNKMNKINEIKKMVDSGVTDKVIMLVKKYEDENLNGYPTIDLYEDEKLIERIQKKWADGYIDNFNYLMMINICSGRSLRFISSYFIFPHIIKDYSNMITNRDQSMRDLSKPMSIVLRKDVSDLIEKYKQMPEGMGFHHGSLYSNKNILEHYLYRIMPYTQYQFDLNDGRTDSFGRMFKNFDKNFTLCAEHNFFEMIPENYYLEYYLLNSNNLRFYEEEDQVLDNVELPQWAGNNPRYFTLSMRRSLECDYVGSNIGKWIDLIFGIAQIGNKAVERINVYQSGNYLYGPHAIKNTKKSTPLDFVYPFQCGQVAGRIFNDDHPNKIVKTSDMNNNNILHKIIVKENLISIKPVGMFYNEYLKKLSPSFLMSKLTKLNLSDNSNRYIGPIDYIMKKMKMKQPDKNKDKLYIDDVYQLHQGSFIIEGNMLGTIYNNILLCIAQKYAYIAYIHTYDISSYHYDTYNRILWIGNSIGELYGYTIHISYNNHSDKSRLEAGTGVLCRDSKRIDMIDITDSNVNVLREVFMSYMCMQSKHDEKTSESIKKLYHCLFRHSSKSIGNVGDNMYDCRSHVTFIMKDYHMCTESSEVSIIRSSNLSNIIISINTQSIVFIWDIYDKCLLIRMHTPHYLQPLLVNHSDDRYTIDFRKYLNKDIVKIQRPVSINISIVNEDIAVVSEDYISIYSINGVLIASHKRSKGHNNYTCVYIADVDIILYRIHSYTMIIS